MINRWVVVWVVGLNMNVRVDGGHVARVWLTGCCVGGGPSVRLWTATRTSGVGSGHECRLRGMGLGSTAGV